MFYAPEYHRKKPIAAFCGYSKAIPLNLLTAMITHSQRYLED